MNWYCLLLIWVLCHIIGLLCHQFPHQQIHHCWAFDHCYCSLKYLLLNSFSFSFTFCFFGLYCFRSMSGSWDWWWNKPFNIVIVLLAYLFDICHWVIVSQLLWNKALIHINCQLWKETILLLLLPVTIGLVITLGLLVLSALCWLSVHPTSCLYYSQVCCLLLGLLFVQPHAAYCLHSSLPSHLLFGLLCFTICW